MNGCVLNPDNRKSYASCDYAQGCTSPGRFAIRALDLNEEPMQVCANHLPRAVSQKTKTWGALIIQCNDHLDL